MKRFLDSAAYFNVGLNLQNPVRHKYRIIVLLRVSPDDRIVT